LLLAKNVQSKALFTLQREQSNSLQLA